MPPRATSKTAKSTRGFCSTMRALRGPDASALISSRSSMTTPSVEVIPTLRPIPLKMWLIIRDVVVFPLVPVTATIGMRDGVPGGNSMSTTGLEMNCVSPMVGCVCIRNPGAAFTSQIAPPVARTGSVMSGQMKSMPAMSRPTMRAASSAMSTFSGCASQVGDIQMPLTDTATRVGVRELDELLDGRRAVAHHVRRDALGDGDHPTVDDEAAVVLAG